MCEATLLFVAGRRVPCPNNQAEESFLFFLAKHSFLNTSLLCFSSFFPGLVLAFPPLSLSNLQRFPEPGTRHHGPSGATCQDDPEGKNKEQTQNTSTTSSCKSIMNV